MAVKSLEDLFLETVKDIYYAEKKLLRALPKLAKHAKSPELKQAFQTHATETGVHVERLDEVFAELDRKPVGKKCAAMDGLVTEAEEIMEDIADPRALDAGLIAAAQAAEHYEIARYGTLACWARELGMKKAEKLLQKTLDEEKATDQKLSGLAESYINQQAA